MWTLAGPCGLLNACHHQVTIMAITITYRHDDATDSPMFSLAPILPMFDVQYVRIGLTLIITFICSFVFTDIMCNGSMFHVAEP